MFPGKISPDTDIGDPGSSSTEKNAIKKKHSEKPKIRR